MRKSVTYFAIITCLLSFTLSSRAQAPSGRIVDRILNTSGDTIVLERSYSEWRFGASLSGTLHYHFGSFYIPEMAQFPGHGYIPLDAGGFGGGGISAGLAADWQPVGDEWGMSLLLNVIDYRSTTSYTQIKDLPPNAVNFLDNKISLHPSVTYLSFMPSARYNTEIEGLHYLMGLDIDILTNSEAYRINTAYENERVDVVRPVRMSANKFRIGGHFGAGWDLYAGLVDEFRMTLTPYVMVHLGSNMYSQNGSNWNSAYVRGGFALKFGEDEFKETIIPRDETIETQQEEVLSFNDQTKLNVEIPETDRGSFIATLVPVIVADVPAVNSNPTFTSTTGKVPPVAKNRGANNSNARTEGAAPSVSISANQQRVFSTYATPFDTSLGGQLKSYLDGVADYLSKNPTSEVRIIGHADNFGGSPTETQRISDERALQVVRYLMRKGISRDRLLASGLGSRKPIQDNKTPKGRSANRRVEITIVQ